MDFFYRATSNRKFIKGCILQSPEIKMQSLDHLLKNTGRPLSEEEFSEFIRNHASVVRLEVAKAGYYKLTAFEKKLLEDKICFTPLQKAFLLLYFQPFAVTKRLLSLPKRDRGLRAVEKRRFLENIPYLIDFNLDEYLHHKDFSKDEISIIPSAGKAGVPFIRMEDPFYPGNLLRGLAGVDCRIYQNLRSGNLHSDGNYSFILMDAKGALAITSFDIKKEGPVVKQIQGMKGARDELANWPWESALFHIVEAWAEKQGYKMVQLSDPQEVVYTQLDPRNEHFVPLERMSTRFERIEKRRNLHHNGTRYVKSLPVHS